MVFIADENPKPWLCMFCIILMILFLFIGVLKLTDIQNMIHHNGKIHVTLNGEPLVESSLPQLFHGGGDYVTDEKLNRIIRKGVAVETDEEKIDFALAKHFLQEEVKKKQKLQMKIKMFSERVIQLVQSLFYCFYIVI